MYLPLSLGNLGIEENLPIMVRVSILTNTDILKPIIKSSSFLTRIYPKMAKKSKDKKEAASISLQKTGKFTVWDAPGVTQPVPEAPASRAPAADTEKGSKETKDGKQGRRAKASTGPRMDESGELLGTTCFDKRTNKPEWLKDRLATYESISQLRAKELESKAPVAIQVTLPDGKVLSAKKDGTPYMAWQTTPYDVAATISQGLADSVAVCRVTYEDFVSDYSLDEDGMGGEDLMMDSMEDVETKANSQKTYLWDLTRPLVGSVSKLELLKFGDDQDAKTVFWHSSAHMLGEAMEHLWGARLTIGPPLKGGFYYDCYMGTDDLLREEDCKYNQGFSIFVFFCFSSQHIHKICFSIIVTPYSQQQINPLSKKLPKSPKANKNSNVS